MSGGSAYFNRSEVIRIGFDLSNQKFKPPKEFGPYYFIASPYPFPGRVLLRSVPFAWLAGFDHFCDETH